MDAAGGWLLAYAAAAPSDALTELRRRMGGAPFERALAQGAATGDQRAVEWAMRD